jgi:hypothetical protein
MAAFFSGTDISTLQSEGNDQNCFVSLIVNNEGKYCAAVTRKIKEKKEITTHYYGKSYEFFGNGEVKIEPSYKAPEVNQEYIDVEAIEYFMLDVEVEKVDNPLAYLDERFEEIRDRKKRTIVSYVKDEDNQDFYTWMHSKKDNTSVIRYTEDREEEPALFSNEEMDDMVDIDRWIPRADIIYKLVSQMLLCSLIADTKTTDMQRWASQHMPDKYAMIFGESAQFDNWKEFIIEFQISQYSNEAEVPQILLLDAWELYQSKIASAMYRELGKYTTNDYIESYKEVLTRYRYE